MKSFHALREELSGSPRPVPRLTAAPKNSPRPQPRPTAAPKTSALPPRRGMSPEMNRDIRKDMQRRSQTPTPKATPKVVPPKIYRGRTSPTPYNSMRQNKYGRQSLATA